MVDPRSVTPRTTFLMLIDQDAGTSLPMSQLKFLTSMVELTNQLLAVVFGVHG